MKGIGYCHKCLRISPVLLDEKYACLRRGVVAEYISRQRYDGQNARMLQYELSNISHRYAGKNALRENNAHNTAGRRQLKEFLKEKYFYGLALSSLS